MLKDQGYNVGIVDGISGKITVREIKNWQFLNGFNESGNINENQLNTLRKQNSRGKNLNNNEMKVIEERNKKAPIITRKSNIQKKEKEELGFFENILVKGAVIFLATAVFFLVIGDFGEKRDKRFRSGYKHDTTDLTVIGCISFFISCALMYLSHYLYG